MIKTINSANQLETIYR